MSFRGNWFYNKLFYIKWCIELITFIITILCSLYVEIKLCSAMKESLFFKMTLFFVCIMYLPWLYKATKTFILLGGLFLQKNPYAELKDYFGWWVVDVLMFLMYNLVLSFGLIFKNGIGF